jgi:glycosyltransferase
MEEQLKISVITATWNSAQTIRDTLASFNAQDYKNTEYIVVDGASTDDTVAIIKESCVRVDVLVSEKDRGIYDALNKGIALATGDVIGFLHSDDIYADALVLSRIADAFTAYNTDSVYGDLEYVSKDSPDKVIRRWKSGDFDRNKMKSGWMPPHPTFYMKRRHYQQLGGFDLDYKIAADYDSILRYLWLHQLTAAYIPEVLVKMRVGGESNRSFSNILQKSREDRRAMVGNDLPWVRALISKNLSKIPQFFA